VNISFGCPRFRDYLPGGTRERDMAESPAIEAVRAVEGAAAPREEQFLRIRCGD
jgi:hypothetical protein